MIKGSQVRLLLVGLVWLMTYLPSASWAAAAVTQEKLEKSFKGQEDQPTIKVEEIVYTDNHWWSDFEAHFFISLPFTALYSYVTVSSLDAIVQGQYPTSFRTTNTWIIAGLAIGGSLAIAMGSTGRVRDQSIPRTSHGVDWQEAGTLLARSQGLGKFELLKILY